MSIISEIAAESTIGVIVQEIKKELEKNKDKPDVCTALKKIGRFALTKFDWSTPDWTKEYDNLFEASAEEKHQAICEVRMWFEKFREAKTEDEIKQIKEHLRAALNEWWPMVSTIEERKEYFKIYLTI